MTPPADLNGLVRFADDEIWFLRVCHHIPTGPYLPVYRHASYWIGRFRQSLWSEEIAVICNSDGTGNDTKTGVRCRIGLLDLEGRTDRLPRKVGKKDLKFYTA